MSYSFKNSVAVPARMVFLMWGIFAVESLYSTDFGIFGIWPREFRGLLGLITAPLLHGNSYHLISNTFPLLFLGTTVFFFYDRIAIRVFFQCYFVPNFLVWLFARPNIHIGASGLIYGLASFLIFYGIFRKDIKSLLLSIVITLLYGTLIYGVFPNQYGVSWESHLFGAVVGALSASIYARKKRVSS